MVREKYIYDLEILEKINHLGSVGDDARITVKLTLYELGVRTWTESV
jgi:hypothetical protein